MRERCERLSSVEGKRTRSVRPACHKTTAAMRKKKDRRETVTQRTSWRNPSRGGKADEKSRRHGKAERETQFGRGTDHPGKGCQPRKVPAPEKTARGSTTGGADRRDTPKPPEKGCEMFFGGFLVFVLFFFVVGGWCFGWWDTKNKKENNKEVEQAEKA